MSVYQEGRKVVLRIVIASQKNPCFCKTCFNFLLFSNITLSLFRKNRPPFKNILLGYLSINFSIMVLCKKFPNCYTSVTLFFHVQASFSRPNHSPNKASFSSTINCQTTAKNHCPVRHSDNYDIRLIIIPRHIFEWLNDNKVDLNTITRSR